MRLKDSVEIKRKEITKWPKVAIIILNWNGWKDTIECLESLQRLTYPNYQIIVIDNGSTDSSIEKIKAWANGEILVESKFFNYDSTIKPVQCIEYDRLTAKGGGVPEEEAKLERFPPNQKMIIMQIGENLGFAGGNNIGLQYALMRDDFKCIWLLNNDTIIDKNALEYLVEFSINSKGNFILGSKIINYFTGELEHIGGIFDQKAFHFVPLKLENGMRGVLDVDVISGCSFFIEKEILKRLGLLPEFFFMYGEEDYYCYLAKRKSPLEVEIKTILKSVIYHKGEGSTKNNNNINFFKIYYQTRNFFIFTIIETPGCRRWILVGRRMMGSLKKWIKYRFNAKVLATMIRGYISAAFFCVRPIQKCRIRTLFKD